MLDAPSPKKLGLAGGGECTLDDELPGLRVETGADIDGLRLAALNGRPSSESLSPVVPPAKHAINKIDNRISTLFFSIH